MSETNGGYVPNQRIEDLLTRVGFDARMAMIFIFQAMFLMGFIMVGADLLFNVNVPIGDTENGSDLVHWITGVLIMAYSVIAYGVARFTGDLESMRPTDQLEDKK